VIRFAKAIPKDHINDEIGSQLADAATSTAADELTRIFVRSRETARSRQKRERERQERANRPGADR
jgi:hypothetical protein